MLTAYQVISMGVFGESKWLAAWLPEDALATHNTHEMDTNEFWLDIHLSVKFLLIAKHDASFSRCGVAGAVKRSGVLGIWPSAR